MDASLDCNVLCTILGSLTLTYDFVSIIIVYGACILCYLRLESQSHCVDSSLDSRVAHTILGHFKLDIDFYPHFYVFRV